MVRGLILGGLAFAAVFAAERQFEIVSKELERYDKLRAMSGEKPFLREQLGNLAGLLTGGATGNGAPASFVGSLQEDLVRYARLRAM